MTDYNSNPMTWVDDNGTAHSTRPSSDEFWGPAVPAHDGMVLAMSYVKRQKWGETLDCEAGLAKGTIFPELVKPFLGHGGQMR